MKRVLRSRLRRTVLVTLEGGAAFRGVLWEARSDGLVLRNAEHVEAGGDRVPVIVDGELVVLAANVQFIQVL